MLDSGTQDGLAKQAHQVVGQHGKAQGGFRGPEVPLSAWSSSVSSAACRALRPSCLFLFCLWGVIESDGILAHAARLSQ